MKILLEQGFGGFFIRQKPFFLLWVSVFLGLGAACYFAVGREPSFLATGTMLASSIAATMAGFWRWHAAPDRVIRQFGMVIACAILTFCAGFASAQFQAWRDGTPMLTRDMKKPVMVQGILEHLESREAGKGKLLILRDVAIANWDDEITPRRVRLTSRKNVTAMVGDRVSVLAKLVSPSPPVMPGDYDFQRHYFFEGIGALGFILSDVKVLAQGEADKYPLHNIRRFIAERIAQVVPLRQSGIVTALMTGERAAIEDADWQALRISGLAHIISISGLHVAMVAGPVFFVVRFLLACIPALALRYPIKKYAAAVALAVCSLYVGLVVPSVPTTRALLMTGIALIAVMLDRPPISLRLVAIAAIVIILWEPASIWSVSFQMSFAAVAGLVAVAEAMAPRWANAYRDSGLMRRILLWCFGSIGTSFVAFAVTAPLSLYHFQQFPTYSVLANFLSLPITGLIIMPMMIVSYVMIPLGLEHPSLAFMGQGVAWLLDFARFVETLPAANIAVTSPPFGFLWATMLCGLTLLFLQGKEKLWALPFVVYALMTWGMQTPPVFLASEEGRVVGVRSVPADGPPTLYLSSLRAEKFVTENWRKALGIPDGNVHSFPREGANDANIMCDRAVCRIMTENAKISYGEKAYELAEDCAWADIIVTRTRLPRGFCGNFPVRIFDYYALKKSGAFIIDEGGAIITVADLRGERPWNNGYIPAKRQNSK